MQSKDLKTGVVYALGASKYETPRPAVLLDAANTYIGARHLPSQSAFEHEKARNSVHYQTYLKIMAEPYWSVGRRDPKTGKPMVNFPGHDYGYGGQNTGYLVATIQTGYQRPSVTPELLRRLRSVTLEEVLAITPNDSRAGSLPGVEITVVRPRDLVGEWEAVTEAREAEAELKQNLADQALAESKERIAKATERVEALRALNLPGRFADPTESRRNWSQETPKYAGNTKSVSLTLAQVDALLSLIPEGVVYTPPSDTEDDGWTLRKPEYDIHE